MNSCFDGINKKNGVTPFSGLHRFLYKLFPYDALAWAFYFFVLRVVRAYSVGETPL